MSASCNADTKAATAAKRAAGINMQGKSCQHAVNRKWAELRTLIPNDTRDLTGRFMGDPIKNDPRRAG